MEKILSLKFSWIKLLSIFFFILLLSAYTHIFSFFPGETLDPTCPPTETGCTVTNPSASSTVDGILSSTDWNTFNTKQDNLGFTPYNATNPNGYISSESDPIFSSWNKSSGISITKSQVSNFPTTLSSFTNDLGNYGSFVTGTPWTLMGYLTTETDPIWTSVSSNYYTKSDIQSTGLVASSIKITTGAASGYFLKSDDQGNGAWTPIAASQVFKGTWNASTNTPTLSNGTGTSGWYYRVTVAGSWNSISFNVGDDMSYNGTIWERIPAATIVGQALTKTDDTNVTLSLGGSPSTSLLNAASLTLGWTGLLSPTRGGTGSNNTGNLIWTTGGDSRYSRLYTII
jgi:hypothetical protein